MQSACLYLFPSIKPSTSHPSPPPKKLLTPTSDYNLNPTPQEYNGTGRQPHLPPITVLLPLPTQQSEVPDLGGPVHPLTHRLGPRQHLPQRQPIPALRPKLNPRRQDRLRQDCELYCEV